MRRCAKSPLTKRRLDPQLVYALNHTADVVAEHLIHLRRLALAAQHGAPSEHLIAGASHLFYDVINHGSLIGTTGWLGAGLPQLYNAYRFAQESLRGAH